MHIQGRIRILTKSRSLALACSAMLALGACEGSREAPTEHTLAEMAWARAALERNPNLEVVATDSDAGVFTVRDMSERRGACGESGRTGRCADRAAFRRARRSLLLTRSCRRTQCRGRTSASAPSLRRCVRPIGREATSASDRCRAAELHHRTDRQPGQGQRPRGKHRLGGRGAGERRPPRARPVSAPSSRSSAKASA